MNPETPYKRINCSFYDELELRAMRDKKVLIEVHPQFGGQQIESRILTFEVKDHAEWMVLPDDVRIRLDHIRAVDGIPFDKYDDDACNT